MVSVPDGGDLVEESERFERLDGIREECARERERRMELERVVAKALGVIRSTYIRTSVEDVEEILERADVPPETL